MPSLALLHTVSSLVAVFEPLVAEEMPEWQPFNIVDESLLRNTVRDGVLSTRTIQRLSQYVFSAADAGAQAIVVTCSSLGGAVDLIRPLSPVPLYRIDQGMALEAVTRAERIGVLATLPTTLVPTSNLIHATAAAEGRNCQIAEKLCDGAFDCLARGDRAGHDERVIAGFNELAARSDLIVLAQASMANALSLLDPVPAIPVLSSPWLGIRHVAAQLSRMDHGR